MFGILVANRVGVKGDLTSLLWSPNFQFFSILFSFAHGLKNDCIKLTRARDNCRVVKSTSEKNWL